MSIEECKFYDKETGCIECKQVFVQGLYKAIKQLKEENEELKKLVENYRNNYNNSILKQGELVSKNGDIYNKYQQTKQKLEKIELAIELYNDCYEGTPDECINKILKIIRGED